MNAAEKRNRILLGIVGLAVFIYIAVRELRIKQLRDAAEKEFNERPLKGFDNTGRE